MKDRVPLYPGRVTLTPVAGQANTYDLMRADQPTQEGTPLNKANLLADATAGRFGLSGEAATVNGVLDVIGQKFCLKTEIITSTRTWTMPSGVKNNTVQVRLFGGGGGGGLNGGGGGGGEMAVQSIALTPGTQVSITIGAGGACGAAGGASAFGGYLSASGGAAGGYDGGSGGSGGGGGVRSLYSGGTTYYYPRSGGNATYGGGGGAGYGADARSDETVHGGNGGTYGGGGGITDVHQTQGTGGTYGGAGSGYADVTHEAPGGGSYVSKGPVPGVDGTDTRGMGLEFEGDGKASQTDRGGGGGYGGRGGDGLSNHDGGGGGGGGYGADGGNGSFLGESDSYAAGGGGGGYGGRGGHAKDDDAGGGGGYGRSGAGGDAVHGDYSCIYRTNGGIAAGGAGAAHHISGTRSCAGGDGICIITYTLGVSE